MLTRTPFSFSSLNSGLTISLMDLSERAMYIEFVSIWINSKSLRSCPSIYPGKRSSTLTFSTLKAGKPQFHIDKVL